MACSQIWVPSRALATAAPRLVSTRSDGLQESRRMARLIRSVACPRFDPYCGETGRSSTLEHSVGTGAFLLLSTMQVSSSGLLPTRFLFRVFFSRPAELRRELTNGRTAC